MFKNKNRKVKPVNYLILSVICAVVIGIVVYLCSWYKLFDNEKKKIPVIRDSLFEISGDEIDHYIMDNPTCVLYMCVSSTNNCRSYEKDFIKLINSNNLKGYIVYVNLSNVDSIKFIDDFNNKYALKKKINYNYPTLVMIEDGKIDNFIQSSKDNNISMSDTKKFLELNGIGEEVE